MWVMTQHGFWSVVEHRDKPGTLMVRARVRGDLDTLVDRVPGLEIAHTPERDYEWRVELPADRFAQIVADVTAAIDYGNFKDMVAARQGRERASVYGRVWSTLHALRGGGA